jgi:hypothetical protein
LVGFKVEDGGFVLNMQANDIFESMPTVVLGFQAQVSIRRELSLGAEMGLLHLVASGC